MTIRCKLQTVEKGAERRHLWRREGDSRLRPCSGLQASSLATSVWIAYWALTGEEDLDIPTRQEPRIGAEWCLLTLPLGNPRQAANIPSTRWLVRNGFQKLYGRTSAQPSQGCSRGLDTLSVCVETGTGRTHPCI